MAPSVIVTHYPEGAGHATRMMAVAQALEDRGLSVTLGGGGHGKHFYELGGFDGKNLTEVDYIGDFQQNGGAIHGLRQVLTDSLPDSARRVREIADWLGTEQPDAVVTDDMFTAAAAVRTRTPLYVLTHNAADLYQDWIVKLTTRGLTIGQNLVSREFFYPTVWPPHASDPPQVSRVPPVALEEPSGIEKTGPDDPGTLLVPSVYSTAFDELAETLREDGRAVTNVGSPDWELLPSLLPVLRRADVVVCAGYSTIMEAAVAGTPCIVMPTTNEQRGVARRLDDVRGFTVVDSHEGIQRALADPPDPPEYVNGISTIAERVFDDLHGA